MCLIIILCNLILHITFYIEEENLKMYRMILGKVSS